MSTTQKKLITPGQLSAVTATYYTVPGSTRTTLSNALLQNTTATPVEVTIYLVQSGGSASTSNQALKVKVPGSYTRACFELVNASMSAGDTFEAVADTASAATLHLSGKEEV